MPRYSFHIRQDGHSSEHVEGLELPDRVAAWQEATTVCADLARGIIADFEK
jgi:hypothetical protein